jgi:hypothetical protein
MSTETTARPPGPRSFFFGLPLLGEMETRHAGICLLFNSLEDFLAAFMPHAPWMQGDMLNYTDVER